MIRGLVIGKFLPIHKGHIELIRSAAKHCDEVIVSMSYTPHDTIEAGLRLGWIKTIFQYDTKIHPEMIKDDFDDESLPLAARTKVWAEVIKKTYGAIDVVVSSEEYGFCFAHNLGARHILFDQPRQRVPVSATLIRNNPYRHWDYIPQEVRPYFVKKICFYGPESTGKSIMTQHMAARYNTTYVPEVARELITSNSFSIDDILNIAHAHHARIDAQLTSANKILFCDTDVITTQLYSQYYLHTVPEILVQYEKRYKYDHYFLFDVDVPWIEDGLRDLGHIRMEMFELFKNALDDRSIAYTLVQGTYAEREARIVSVVDAILGVC